MENLKTMNPQEVRQLIRKGDFTGPTSGLCPGYVQANLVILPKEIAFDFMIFANRNPKPCPVIDITEPGKPVPSLVAPDASIITDLPKYRIYLRGELSEEVLNIGDYWREDFVGFLLGCSFTFESALIRAGIPIRHIEENKNVPMYITNIKCKNAGIFEGPMVVSMRPVHYDLVVKAVQVTSRFPSVHGAPVHIGNPKAIGIKDIDRPDFGDPVTIKDGEVPVFWACGVTPQAVAMRAKPDIMITHSPGHMFISDIREEELSIF